MRKMKTIIRAFKLFARFENVAEYQMSYEAYNDGSLSIKYS